MSQTADTDSFPGPDRTIVLHGEEGFEGMRRAGALAAGCLDMLTAHVVPGVTGMYLDTLVREYVLDHGAVPATVGYRGFRHSSCISPNHVICHGIPGDRPFRKGDILNIDVTVVVDGWHGDTSRMFFAGRPKVKACRLVEAAYDSMMAAIATVRPGSSLREIGRAIQERAEAGGFSVVRDFCGHGLGRTFHAPPNVVHYARYRDRSGVLHEAPDIEVREGMFFTIEPMLNEGRPHAKVLADGWTAVSRDRSLSAQFEHSVGVTADGAEIFTVSPGALHRPPY